MANAAKSKARVGIAYVFAQRKEQMGLFIRTIGFHCGINLLRMYLVEGIVSPRRFC